MHKKTVTIKETHLDSFDHVNNATYLELFEEARWDLITEGGYGLDRIKETGIGPTILAIDIKFKRELRLREKITIETELQSFEGKIGKIKQEMLLKDGSLACEALFTIAVFDMEKRKLVEPDEAWLTALGK